MVHQERIRELLSKGESYTVRRSFTSYREERSKLDLSEPEFNELSEAALIGAAKMDKCDADGRSYDNAG